jgi:hypothetical protein
VAYEHGTALLESGHSRFDLTNMDSRSGRVACEPRECREQTHLVIAAEVARCETGKKFNGILGCLRYQHPVMAPGGEVSQLASGADACPSFTRSSGDRPLKNSDRADTVRFSSESVEPGPKYFTVVLERQGIVRSAWRTRGRATARSRRRRTIG